MSAIQAFLSFLNDNTGALNALFAFVVALATVFYAVLTYHLVGETRSMRKAQTEPRVLVQVEPSDVWISLVNLVIHNVGGGPAYDVKLTCEPDFEWDRGKFVSAWGLFMHGLRHLAPGQTIRQFLTNVLDRPGEIENPDGPFRFTIKASYRNAAGVRFQEEFPIDFLQFVGMISVGTPPDQEMAQSLKRLQEDVRRILTGANRIRADVFTAADRKAEVDAVLERRAQREAAQDPPQPVQPPEQAG